MATVSAQPISSVDAGNACKRLQKELMGLMMSKDEGISAFPDADNILSWTATIDGADQFQFMLTFRANLTVFMTAVQDPLEPSLKACLISCRWSFLETTLALRQQ